MGEWGGLGSMSTAFVAMLEEQGLNLQAFEPLYESCVDCIGFDGPQKVTTGISAIDGIGLFACIAIGVAEQIAVARTGGLRTPAGRYTNHSDSPNAIMVKTGDRWCLVARSDIRAGEEILLDYRQVLQLHTRVAE